ncbi:protein scabrous-like [Ceratina calcarata]|uniref:Protein scabrous-like n=1 Tax=Ceratina calcarata TaxID=156304 RepID=A0AAJ7J526_9HYME|nr:protein scabrous-like [Ceratina calcarata]
MNKKSWLSLWILFVALTWIEIRGDESIDDAIRSLREQVNALLEHRQQDYNALEESLKRAMEKNTELFVLKNEVKQLRKEIISMRGGGNGNEAKNERLRVRWLGSAVTELQGEVAQVLRSRNASEELAERSRLKGEMSLLKGDVAAVDREIRNVGGRIAKIEAILGTIRVDILAVKERFGLLSRTCADITSQLSSVQIEVKSLGCNSSSRSGMNSVNSARAEETKAEDELTGRDGGGGRAGGGTTRRTVAGAVDREIVAADAEHDSMLRHGSARRRGYAGRRNEARRTRLEDRLRSIERKISLTSQRLEKRIAANENQEWSNLNKRMKNLEKGQAVLIREISNISENAILTSSIGESIDSRLIKSLRSLEEIVQRNASVMKQELLRFDVNVARKAAELSLTREELGNLRRTVQALSVTTSKLQERCDSQQEIFHRSNGTGYPIGAMSPHSNPLQTRYSSSSSSLSNLEQLEDRYHLIGNDLIGGDYCSEQRTSEIEPTTVGLRLFEPAKGSRPMLIFCREGWIVIARRIDGSLDFDRSWDEYSLGFGSPVTEYWIGNEILHELTRDNCSSLRIDMLDIYGERWRAEYRVFTVDSEENGYRLRVGEYTGNATDAFSYQNGMAFSTRDRDMDVSPSNCAQNYHGGWWFSRCQHANLNGKYSLGLTWYRSDTNRWMSIASSEMSIRRNFDCRSR